MRIKITFHFIREALHSSVAALIILAGSALRIYLALFNQYIEYDEAVFLDMVRLFLNGNIIYSDFLLFKTPLHVLFSSIFVIVFGDAILSLRFFSIFMSLFTMLLLYVIVRLWLNTLYAHMALVFYSFSPISIEFDTIGKAESMFVAFSMLFFYLISRLLIFGGKKNLVLLSSIAGALLVLSHVRVFIPMFLGALIFLIIQRRFKTALLIFSFTLAFATIFVSPFVILAPYDFLLNVVIVALLRYHPSVVRPLDIWSQAYSVYPLEFMLGFGYLIPMSVMSFIWRKESKKEKKFVQFVSVLAIAHILSFTFLFPFHYVYLMYGFFSIFVLGFVSLLVLINSLWRAYSRRKILSIFLLSLGLISFASVSIIGHKEYVEFFSRYEFATSTQDIPAENIRNLTRNLFSNKISYATFVPKFAYWVDGKLEYLSNEYKSLDSIGTFEFFTIKRALNETGGILNQLFLILFNRQELHNNWARLRGETVKYIMDDLVKRAEVIIYSEEVKSYIPEVDLLYILSNHYAFLYQEGPYIVFVKLTESGVNSINLLSLEWIPESWFGLNRPGTDFGLNHEGENKVIWINFKNNTEQWVQYKVAIEGIELRPNILMSVKLSSNCPQNSVVFNWEIKTVKGTIRKIYSTPHIFVTQKDEEIRLTYDLTSLLSITAREEVDEVVRMYIGFINVSKRACEASFTFNDLTFHLEN
ncbi:MAG: glycosyltransferase family 39 protein [Aigarchaeota archaeon]|nr:glycosyltransferase family 39 protein [Aigarchaeota archaeon]MDW8092657.1 glycosyltransferase family 39 protein [Nitrososphaerota archaeon]